MRLLYLLGWNLSQAEFRDFGSILPFVWGSPDILQHPGSENGPMALWDQIDLQTGQLAGLYL